MNVVKGGNHGRAGGKMQEMVVSVYVVISQISLSFKREQSLSFVFIFFCHHCG